MALLPAPIVFLHLKPFLRYNVKVLQESIATELVSIGLVKHVLGRSCVVKANVSI
jgi:hypothetical protein